MGSTVVEVRVVLQATRLRRTQNRLLRFRSLSSSGEVGLAYANDVGDLPP